MNKNDPATCLFLFLCRNRPRDATEVTAVASTSEREMCVRRKRGPAKKASETQYEARKEDRHEITSSAALARKPTSAPSIGPGWRGRGRPLELARARHVRSPQAHGLNRRLER